MSSWASLTVNVVLEGADTLLVQAQHGWEKNGLGTRVHLHLPVETLAGEDCRLLRDVTDIRLHRLLLHFKTKAEVSRAK